MQRRHILLMLRRVIVLSILMIGAAPSLVAALQNPQSGSVALQGTIQSPPPTQGATPTSPGNGTTVTTQPVTVSGSCPSGTLVKVFSNGVFIGSVVCSNGAFSLQVDLFSGSNNITAIDYDALDQAGPTTTALNVTYSGSQFGSLGPQLTVSSSYAERGTDPGQQLTWPIILNGGNGPYAISVDWGDGQAPELLSESSNGTIQISHTYSSAGTYTVTVRVTDANGQTAFLQLVGVANGPISQSNSKPVSTTITKTEVVWWPSAFAIPLIIITFWLGRRYELGALRKRLERQERL